MSLYKENHPSLYRSQDKGLSIPGACESCGRAVYVLVKCAGCGNRIIGCLCPDSRELVPA